MFFPMFHEQKGEAWTTGPYALPNRWAEYLLFCVGFSGGHFSMMLTLTCLNLLTKERITAVNVLILYWFLSFVSWMFEGEFNGTVLFYYVLPSVFLSTITVCRLVRKKISEMKGQSAMALRATHDG